MFIDIVGYSKLSIDEQRAAIRELTRAVRTSRAVSKGEAAARLIRIPNKLLRRRWIHRATPVVLSNVYPGDKPTRFVCDLRSERMAEFPSGLAGPTPLCGEP
jgi:hypothetical protein